MTEQSARIKYVVLAHHAPDQLARLVQRLQHDDASFFVHIDRRAPDSTDAAIRSRLHGMPRVSFVPRQKVAWGGYGIVRATLEGLQVAAADRQQYDFAVLLSGQDYPLKPTDEIHAWLAERRGDAFLNHVRVAADSMSEWLGRFTGWHWRGYVLGRYQMFPHPRLPLPTWRRTFLAGVTPFAGSMYWALPQEAVAYVLEFVDENPKFVRFFHHVDFPDESFFQTIMLNSPLASTVTDANLHFIDWSERQSRPKTLGATDVDAALASGKLFARKFDDMRILDLIDERVDAGR